MPVRKSHDVVATIGTYKDRDGAEKKRYLNVGSAFTSEDGNISIKLDAVPVTPEWSGWLSLYVPKERGQQSERPRQSSRQSSGPAVPDPDDDIPFAPNVL